jgi:adenosine deaminase
LNEKTRDLIGKMPKVEQHIHIVGSIRTKTLLWLSSDGDRKTCGLENYEDVKSLFRYRSFSHFIECYSTVTHSISKEKQFERIVYEMLDRKSVV